MGTVTPSSTDTFTNKTFDANGTGNSLSNVDVADLSDGTDGELITWSAAGTPATVGVGTVGQVLTSGGVGVAPTMQDATGGGKVVQIVNVTDGAVATGTTTIPDDDTIPQSTEGDEYMTLAVTPTNASNNLKIDVVVTHSSSTGARIVSSLFQDTTANALAASLILSGTNFPTNVKYTYTMAAGTTSATTFKVRIGGLAAGTITFNGISSVPKLGGVIASSITITEYEL